MILSICDIYRGRTYERVDLWVLERGKPSPSGHRPVQDSIHRYPHHTHRVTRVRPPRCSRQDVVDQLEQVVKIPNGRVFASRIMEVRLRVGDLGTWSAIALGSETRGITSVNMLLNSMYSLVSFLIASSNSFMTGWMSFGWASTCSIVSLRNL
jgi:hypothetical protein